MGDILIVVDAVRLYSVGSFTLHACTRLDLPYDRPCQNWIGQLEKDIGFSNVKETGCAHIWKI